ncbi:hypothetical protein [Pseudomonas proteolytica]|uniref:hypothetical protein n=1 Tax=Pseudomonas proteolytica TaxID=219574 RepID=UPI0021CC6592|nr:hypothetical protein [Pseudomonas proteolytica]
MQYPWKHAFHSGMSSSSDLRAAIQAGVPVGVVANLLTNAQVFLALPKYLNGGGMVFVDSGAFTAFQKREVMKWNKVFFTYDALINQTDFPCNLSIVAPDVVGDQAATLGLWHEHATQISGWIERGVRVIVPLQKGALSAGSMLEKATEIFKTSRFAAGIPSNLEALTAADCSTLWHQDFHILGRVKITPDLSLKLQALSKNNPGAQFTSDANWLRSRLKKISSMQTTRLDMRYQVETRRTQAVRAVLDFDAYMCAVRI